MPITQCLSCGGDHAWNWSEAFDKFGFNDGDGQVETHQVVNVLAKFGYRVETEQWGLHNTVVTSIIDNDVELMPGDDSDVSIGYDDPRSYLPSRIISILDESLPDVD